MVSGREKSRDFDGGFYFFRHKTMWGWGRDKTETVEKYEGKIYDATGIDVVTRIRFEHMTEEDKEKAKGKQRLGDWKLLAGCKTRVVEPPGI